MDDLSGLDWSSTNPSKDASKPPPMNSMNSMNSLNSMNSTNPPTLYPTLRPTPSPQPSARSTPLSTQGSAFAAPKPQAGKPTTDSFSGLVSFTGAKSNANLTLRERQEQLEAQKRQKEEEERQRLQSQYGGGQFWDNIGQGSTPASRTLSPAIPTPSVSGGIASQNGQKKDDDDDLFAAFNRDTKVDNASHFPPPAQQLSRNSTPANTAQLDLTNANAWNQATTSIGGALGDDDDPFGLNQMKKQPHQQLSLNDDDDDFLGDLAKPVDEVRRKTQAAQPKPEPGRPIESNDSDSEPETLTTGASSDPFDKAVAELVEMGFTAENARRGLTESGAGLNVQAAVGWLLDDAHRQARSKRSPAESAPERTRRDDSRSRNHGNPAWMSRDQADDLPARRDNRSPASVDEFSRRAAAVGSSFFKTANSLWKSGQKQVQKAVADFQQEGGDSNQPKWMRSAHLDRSHAEERASQSATDEALMLESGARPERHSSRPTQSRHSEPRDQTPALPTRPRTHSPGVVPKWQQAVPPSSRDPRARLNKQEIEEQSAQAYVSPARRKKATPQPAHSSESEPNLLFDQPSHQPSQSQPRRSAQSSTPTIKPATRAPSKPITPRPAPPARNIPSIPPSTLEASTRHRLEGAAHFKRGDYDAAYTSYTNSLTGIPQSHPICIVLLTNRALTALKTGSPKQAVSDADAAISIIGPSRGEGEKVALPDGETRDMKDLYGKALSRKAEALEQMEKWTDAGNVWQQCVEAGVGGTNAIAGRQRCQKALAPKPKPAPKPAQVAKPRPKPSAVSDLNPQRSSEAVQRLRQANKEAEAADDEKFALGEKVDARIASWRDGKRDNLRALLGSLDQVLWENSGWKKVGLHELVVANKVKIHYMKAIAKCHPDKVSRQFLYEI
ncbi:uncharacterized protein F4812DRAFT_421254 [Daldinia caldariorum]|uniref:uncharacterized protein n=1 Tax=Daldinia caldariorum TaxID=326644 RepID=UPI0020073BB9|nr:uncharacterized protein F4812DRAFT_421254 [Daldinia caldariorum]KAI1470033.1 hypothetical protein F4812DRAFT_421254 [Daldinia caldariorum]